MHIITVKWIGATGENKTYIFMCVCVYIHTYIYVYILIKQHQMNDSMKHKNHGSSIQALNYHLSLFFFFKGRICSIWKFPGQTNWSCRCSNIRSLTHWARPGIKPSSSQRQYQVLNLLHYNGNSSFVCIYYTFGTHLFTAKILESWVPLPFTFKRASQECKYKSDLI